MRDPAPGLPAAFPGRFHAGAAGDVAAAPARSSHVLATTHRLRPRLAQLRSGRHLRRIAHNA